MCDSMFIPEWPQNLDQGQKREKVKPTVAPLARLFTEVAWHSLQFLNDSYHYTYTYSKVHMSVYQKNKFYNEKWM